MKYGYVSYSNGQIGVYHYNSEEDYWAFKLSKEKLVDEKDMPQRVRDLIYLLDAGADEEGDCVIDNVGGRNGGGGGTWVLYRLFNMHDEIAQLERMEQQNGTLDNTQERCA